MLFSFSGYHHLACALAGVDVYPFSIARYENQEMHAVIPGHLSGERCFILGSIAPPDERLLSFSLLAHTLREHGAGVITAILPYLAYARQDKMKEGESLAAAWAGGLLKASGVDRIVTVDIHSERDRQLFQVPIVSLSPASLFAKEIQSHGLTGATIVAPDHGAIPRCEAIKAAAGLAASETPYFEKKRTKHGVLHGSLVGKTGSQVVLIDDMLDTGGTLVSACERLIQLGVDEIYIFVTHGLFTGEAWQKLWSLGVKHVFCTDTIPQSNQAEAHNISVLPVTPVLEAEFASLDTALPSRGTLQVI